MDYLSLNFASDSGRFNSAFVGSLKNLEVSVVSPGLVPGVGDQPVLGGSFGSVSQDLDGVSSKETSSGVLVDSSLVGQEIFVHREGSFDWSIGGNFSLDVRFSTDSVDRTTEVLIAGVTSRVRRVTLLNTLWGSSFSWARWVLGALDMVSTWSESVRSASGVIVVEITSDKSCILEESPGFLRVSSVATVSAR